MVKTAFFGHFGEKNVFFFLCSDSLNFKSESY